MHEDVHSPLFHEELPDACERISELCQEIRQINQEHRDKFWKLIRVPLTPATILSVATSCAAWIRVIDKESAILATTLSVAYGCYRACAYVTDATDLLLQQKVARAAISCSLRRIHERDVLPVRAMMDDYPEFLPERSNKW